MKEIWREIKGYEGKYQVSNLGRVRSLDRTVQDTIGRTRHLKGKMLKLKKNVKSNYLYVSLPDRYEYVHRLVARAFIPNPNGFPEVNHKDENRSNNIYTNLEWCSRQYNHDYGTRTVKESATKSKPVAQISMAGRIINIFPNAIIASEVTGANRRQIQMVANHYQYLDKNNNLIRYLTAGGYKWKYLD